MGNEQISIIHIDTEKTWRGGQQQVYYLHEALLKRSIDSIMMCPQESILFQYYQKSNLPCISLEFRHELDYQAGIKIAKLAKRINATILHLHSGHSVSSGLWAKLFYHKLKLIATRRVDFSINKNPFSSLKYNTRLLDHIVCVSDNIKQVLIKDGISANKLTTIYSGIKLDNLDDNIPALEIRKQWNVPQNAILIGTIAAFTGHKDYPNLLKAAQNVIKSRDDVYFMAVGDGKLLNETKDLANQYDIADKFIFTGFQTQTLDYLKSFDFFVMASKMEGLGTSILDAMSVGLPIVTTTAGGIPEIIQDGFNGLTVPVSDSIALSDAILRLIHNPSFQTILSSQAKKSVEKFDVKKTVESYIQLYRKILHDGC